AQTDRPPAGAIDASCSLSDPLVTFSPGLPEETSGSPADLPGSPADLRLHGAPQECAQLPCTEALLPLLCGYQTDPGEGGIRSGILPGSPPTDVLEHGCTDPMLQNRRHSPHTPREGRHGLIDREARRLLSVRWPT